MLLIKGFIEEILSKNYQLTDNEFVTTSLGIKGKLVMDNEKKISKMNKTDKNNLRKDFPILERKINGKKLIYTDSAATTQSLHR